MRKIQRFWLGGIGARSPDGNDMVTTIRGFSSAFKAFAAIRRD
jgi:hypothetical protein